MPPTLARDTEIHISATSGGTYTLIGQVHTWTDRRGQQGGQDFFVLGDDTPITEAGSDDASIDINFLLDLADTNGQNIIRTAFDAGTTVFIRMLYDGANGRQQEMKVTSYQASGDANGTGLGRYVAGTCTFTSAGASTPVVGP